MQNPIITCQEVVLAYGSDIILREVNLDVYPGSFIPFVGPNGSGKTTLLRAILGLIPVRSGFIKTPFGETPAGFVPQQQNLDFLFPVTARDIVMMGLFPRLGWWKRPGPADHDLIDSLLERFNLAQHGEKSFDELSGGMRQKILIARALASGAQVLIMDEPTSALDEQSEQEVLQMLFKLSKEEGKTVLFAQHGLDLVLGLVEEVCSVFRGAVRMIPVSQLGKHSYRGDAHD